MKKNNGVWKNYFKMVFGAGLPWGLLIICFLLSLGVATLTLLFASAMATALTNWTNLSDAITPEAEFLTVSLPSSVIFVLATLLALTLTDGVAAVTATNLMLALTPGFLLYGIGCLRAKLKLLPQGTVKRLWLPITVLLICIASSLVLLLSLFGAYDKLFGAIRKKIRQNKNNS